MDGIRGNPGPAVIKARMSTPSVVLDFVIEMSWNTGLVRCDGEHSNASFAVRLRLGIAPRLRLEAESDNQSKLMLCREVEHECRLLVFTMVGTASAEDYPEFLEPSGG
jgi:hypothetical protein